MRNLYSPFLGLFCLSFMLLFSACQKTAKKEVGAPEAQTSVAYAKGFEIEKKEGFQILHIRNPWPGEDIHYQYALIPQNSTVELVEEDFESVIHLPIKQLVVTSTTHIPALEELGALHQLSGFPGTRYISSAAARERIAQGQIAELGPNGQLNVEQVLALQPDLIVGYGMGPDNRSFETLQRAGIPVVLNGDWTETHPLGKAEWIRFFGYLLGKEEQADAFFRSIEANYLQAKKQLSKPENRPKVLSGAVFKDVWYAPAGNSWAATFIEEAGGDYLWKDQPGTGSLSLSLEEVLVQGAQAEFWIAPSQYTSYQVMQEASVHYAALPPFDNKKVYTFAKTKGESGGVLYYELAPYRPDLVLKDLISILHPEVYPDYTPTFFLPLDP